MEGGGLETIGNDPKSAVLRVCIRSEYISGNTEMCLFSDVKITRLGMDMSRVY